MSITITATRKYKNTAEAVNDFHEGVLFSCGCKQVRKLDLVRGGFRLVTIKISQTASVTVKV